jgi:hypothetical protein
MLVRLLTSGSQIGNVYLGRWPNFRRYKPVQFLRSGDGTLSVRVRPSSLKRDCDRRAASTGEKCLVNVHPRSRAWPWSLCGHSGQKPRARPEPARTGRGPSPARCGRSRYSS